MMKVQDFVCVPRQERKKKKQEKITNTASRNQALRETSVHYVIMKVKAGKTTKNQDHQGTANIVTSVSTNMKED
jgi:hypothetical protein